MPPSAANPIPQSPIFPDVGFVRLPQILAAFPVGRSTWWKGVAESRYPAAVKLGPRSTAWRVNQATRAPTNRQTRSTRGYAIVGERATLSGVLPGNRRGSRGRTASYG